MCEKLLQPGNGNQDEKINYTKEYPAYTFENEIQGPGNNIFGFDSQPWRENEGQNQEYGDPQEYIIIANEINDQKDQR